MAVWQTLKHVGRVRDESCKVLKDSGIGVGGLGLTWIFEDSVVGGSGLTVGSGSVVGVGVSGIAGGMGRILIVNGGIVGVVKDIAKTVEAGFGHTHEVGSEEHIVEGSADPLCDIDKLHESQKIHTC